MECIGSTAMKSHLREVFDGRQSSSFMDNFKKRITSKHAKFLLAQTGFGPFHDHYSQVSQYSVVIIENIFVSFIQNIGIQLFVTVNVNNVSFFNSWQRCGHQGLALNSTAVQRIKHWPCRPLALALASVSWSLIMCKL